MNAYDVINRELPGHRNLADDTLWWDLRSGTKSTLNPLQSELNDILLGETYGIHNTAAVPLMPLNCSRTESLQGTHAHP